uniref:Uncharacterized protein n=1 Tax=Ignisphaera aggregans TaxID=334771 RepID=A0A7C5XHP8_9CREN
MKKALAMLFFSICSCEIAKAITICDADISTLSHSAPDKLVQGVMRGVKLRSTSVVDRANDREALLHSLSTATMYRGVKGPKHIIMYG